MQGSGGGPQEDQTTAFLVRSTAEKWGKGSLLAVDAGVHLAAITKLFEGIQTTQATDAVGNPQGKPVVTDGPFKGLELSHKTAKANAGYVTSVLVDTYLITHPHLDHISAFVVNTAGLPGTRQKKLAGSYSTIEAFSNHIFNNIIWPNLSDENNGAGLISYMRLVEGGSSALGEGEAKGFVEVCEGLQVKTWCISHGHCYEKHSHRGSNASELHQQHGHSPSLGPTVQMERSNSGYSLAPDTSRRKSTSHDQVCVYDSSVYLIRDMATGKEVLIFGDVEPDSISLSPRNKYIWAEAAPKIIAGQLGGIFIECSYDDTRAEDVLFGHLAPRYLIEELITLAKEVDDIRNKNVKKRKRDSDGKSFSPRRKSPRAESSPQISPRATHHPRSPSAAFAASRSGLSEQIDASSSFTTPTKESSLTIRQPHDLPLNGLRVVVIHVKDKLTDEPDAGETIVNQLLEHEKRERLGCEFILSHGGQTLHF